MVETTQSKTYVLPEGWDSRSDVAEQLECSEDRVRTLLLPAIKDKTVQVQTFPVYDKLTKKVIRVTAYRRVTQPEVKTKR